MSASLVGSEMCIRDRPSGGPSAAPSAAPRRPLGGLPAVPRRHPGCLSPVSYTHLTLPTICSV
eukprot:3281793-Alexandrium_andersonii.AAC.1